MKVIKKTDFFSRICGVRARVELSHGRRRNGGGDRNGYRGGGGGDRGYGGDRGGDRGRRYSKYLIFV